MNVDASSLFDTLQAWSTDHWMTLVVLVVVGFAAGRAFTRGVLRQLVGMFSLLVGSVVAWYVFHESTSLFGAAAVYVTPERKLWVSLLAGAVVFLICKSLSLWFFAALLVKNWGNLDGWRGSIWSLLPSGFSVWLGATLLRFWSGLQGVEAAAMAQSSDQGVPKARPIIEVVQRFGNDLEQSWVGQVTEFLDPLDTRASANLARLLILWPEGSTWEKLARQADTRGLIYDPRILRLGHDPAVRYCIERHDFASLVRLPQITETAASSDLRHKLRGLDLQRAMEKLVGDV